MTTFWDKVTLRDLQASFDPEKLTLAARLLR